MTTPRIAATITKKPGANRPHRFYFSKLAKDGVHPKPETLKIWAKTLKDAIDRNRGQSHATQMEGGKGDLKPHITAEGRGEAAGLHNISQEEEELDYWFTESDSQGE